MNNSYSTNDKASVCIPAYNEAAHIGKLLRSLLGDQATAIDEILVCANGCTDGTELVVEEIARSDDRVKLMSSAIGKPNAWNALVDAAKNDTIVFVDADVTLGRGSIESLVANLKHNQQSLCVSGINLPSLKNMSFEGFFTGLASMPFVFDYLYGGLYAISRDRVLRQMERFGIIGKQMPLDIVHEDVWLEQVVVRETLLVDRKARAFYDPGTISDVVKARVRLEIAREQMLSEWQGYNGPSWSEEKNIAHRLMEKMRVKSSPLEKIVGLCGTISRNLLLWIKHRETEALRERMRNDVREKRGGLVLATSGRISKKSPKSLSCSENG